MFWSDEDFYAIDTVYFVASKLPLRFLFYELQRKNFINNDAAVPGLNRNQAYSLEVAVPSLELVSRFCELADSFEDQASILRRENQNLRTRDLLLPRLFSGIIDLSDPYTPRSPNSYKGCTAEPFRGAQGQSNTVAFF